MGQTSEAIILTIDINANLNRVTELKQLIADNNKAVAQLTKSFDAGRISQQQYNAQLANYEQGTRQAQKEITQLNRLIDAQTAINKAAADSVNELKGKAALLTQQFNALSKAQRQAAEGQALTAQLRATNEEIASLNAQIGKGTGFFDKLRGQAANLPGPLKGVAGGLAETSSGLLTATKAALAFVATPLGLVLTAITAGFYILKEALTATDEGQEDLAAGTAALGAVFDVLKGVVIGAGKFLVKLFTDPLEAGKELYNFIENQIINRVKALGVIFEALKAGDFKQAANGVLQYATGVEDVIGKTQRLTNETRRVANAAADISRSKDKLEDMEIAAIARGETLRQQAEKLSLTARDQNLSLKQRLDNLAEANRLEKQALDANLAIERERLRIIQAENAEAIKRGILQDDQRRAEAEQVAKLAQLQGEYEKTLQENANKSSRLQAEEGRRQAEAAKKAADAHQQAVEGQIRDRQAAIQTELLTVKEGSERELALRKELVAQKAELEAAGEKKSAAERRLIVATSYVELLKLDEDYQAKREAAAVAFQQKGDAERLAAYNADKKAREDAAREQNDAYTKDLQAVERSLNNRRTAIEESYAHGLTDKREYERSITILDESNYAARIVLGKHYNRDVSKLEEEQASKHRAVLVKQREEDEKSYGERIKLATDFGREVGALFADTLTSAGGTLSNFASRFLSLILDVLQKQLLAGEVGILINSLAKEGPLGLIEAGALTAVVEGAFLAAKSVISQSVPKFEFGGVVPGSSYQGDKVPVLANSGEFILRKEVGQLSPEIPSLLGHLNALAGGINFSPGYVPGTRQASTPDGGLIARQLTQAAFPTAAEIGREVAKNVPTEIGLRTIGEGVRKHNRGKAITTLGGKPSTAFPYSQW